MPMIMERLWAPAGSVRRIDLLSMKVADAVAVAGHEVHVCRYREARTLLRWLGEDLRGLRVLDVAAGDGYWAAPSSAADASSATRPRSSGATRSSSRSATPASTG